MGLFRFSVYGSAAGLAGFWYLARDTRFVPLSKDDDLFQSSHFRKLNPLGNPTAHDLCIQRVPTKKIEQELLKSDGKDGKLVEAFCASVWGGLGYALQRAYFSHKFEGPRTAHQLWTTSALRRSDYPVGTQITDHFEVVEKTPSRIIVRCGDTPRNRGVRAADGLFEMSAVVDKDKEVVEFGLKSAFYSGSEKSEKGPVGPVFMFLHRQYDRLLLGSAILRLSR